jgi:hypothetical protein
MTSSRGLAGRTAFFKQSMYGTSGCVRPAWRAGGPLFLTLTICFLPVGVCPRSGDWSEAVALPSQLAGPAMPFAIAEFDRDPSPGLASIVGTEENGMLARCLQRDLLMRQASHKRDYQTGPKERRSAFHRSLLCALFVLSLFSFTGSACAQSSHAPGLPSISIGPGLQFAIADFDGDHRPDIAYVQAGQGSAGNSSYCVDFRLSSKGRSCFRLVAPSGGLLVEARDVNGDHAVDLVVSTAWFRQPVVVLLNDGHGKFTAARPAAFPYAFQRATGQGFSPQQNLASSVGALTQSGSGVFAEIELSHPLPATRIRLHSAGRILFSPSVLSHHGRAPPIRS